jgi:hypothetical protein
MPDSLDGHFVDDPTSNARGGIAGGSDSERRDRHDRNCGHSGQFRDLVAVGEFQINFTVPQSFASQAAGLYPISIQVNGASSPTMINTSPPASTLSLPNPQARRHFRTLCKPRGAGIGLM